MVTLIKENDIPYIIFNRGLFARYAYHQEDITAKENAPIWHPPGLEDIWVHVFMSTRKNDILRYADIIKKPLDYDTLQSKTVLDIKETLQTYASFSDDEEPLPHIFIVSDEHMFFLQETIIVDEIDIFQSFGPYSDVIDVRLKELNQKDISLKEKITDAYRTYYQFNDESGERIYIINTKTHDTTSIDITIGDMEP